MNERKKIELENEFMQNIGMIGFMKKSGRNPSKYVKQAKKLLKKLERVDPANAWMHEQTLKIKLKQ